VESLWEFIQHFCNKINIILEVDNKSIIMFFKKGLRDSSLIRKLATKNPRISEEMLAIANKYIMADKATLDTDQPSSSKGHDNKRKVDRSNHNVERQ
jgi:hypothetical protein